MKKEEDFSGVRVPFRKSEEVEIVMANVKILDFRKKKESKDQVISQNSLFFKLIYGESRKPLLHLLADISPVLCYINFFFFGW